MLQLTLRPELHSEQPTSSVTSCFLALQEISGLDPGPQISTMMQVPLTDRRPGYVSSVIDGAINSGFWKHRDTEQRTLITIVALMISKALPSAMVSHIIDRSGGRSRRHVDGRSGEGYC